MRMHLSKLADYILYISVSISQMEIGKQQHSRVNMSSRDAGKSYLCNCSQATETRDHNACANGINCDVPLLGPAPHDAPHTLSCSTNSS